MAEILRYAGVDLRTVGIYLDNAEGVDSAPPVRGSNLVIPYQTGQRWASKFYDERHIILNGDMASVVSRADLQTKLDQLKALFPILAGEQKLEAQRADGSFRYVMAEVRNTMGLQRVQFPTRYTPFSIELVASDPYWYSSALEATATRMPWTLDSGVLFDDGVHWFDQTSPYFARILVLSPTMIEASNSGDAPVRKIVFVLQGGMTNPIIKNLRNGLSMSFTRTFLSSEVVTIDCGAQQIYVNGAAVPATGLLTLGAGQADWMRLEPGENTLSIGLGNLPLGSTYTVNYQAKYSAAYL